MWVESDTRKTELTTRGSKYIEVTINYGSRYDSKLAVQILVEYPENNDKPHIHLNIPERIKVYANRAITS